jgi:hypothetical protein
MNKPIIMISSTYYDLKQVRSEMQIFIESLGYESLLSESSTFPINTNMGTIDNCREKVELFADILILVIGGRYGYVDERTNKSITNIEYVEARNKGIPIYVFIESRVLDHLETWKQNKEGNFESVVDNKEVFAFIDRIRSTDSIWTFPFSIVNDIKNVLLNQLAFLYKRALEDSRKIRKIKKERVFEDISSKAMILLVEKPKAWEYRLFFQIWLDEIDDLYEKIYAYENEVDILPSEYVSNDIIFDWIKLRFHEISKYVDSENYLINEKAQEAFGPPGVAGNPVEIIVVAKYLVKTLNSIIDWSMKIRTIKSDMPFTPILDAMSKMTENAIKSMKEFPQKALDEYERVLSIATEENPQKVKLTLTLEISHLEEYNIALRNAKEEYGIYSDDDIDE